MADLLRIYTLGGLQVFKGDEPVTVLETRKVEALLVYLVCSRRVHSREVLAELLWEERSQQQSLANLRVALANLRKYLGEFLQISREGVGLAPGANVWLDVAELEENLSALRTGQGVKTAQAAECVERAATLYRGEFLEGFFVRDCQGFEDWYLRERERLHRLTVEALHDLVDYEIEHRAYKTGIAHAMRLLELDPLMETAHRQMMTLLASSGQRGEALAQYQAYQKILQEELGIEPAAATKALFEKIRQGELAGAEAGAQVIQEPRAAAQIPFTDLPEGTVTFLFTDIEGSTQLLHRLREGYATVLADQRRILREVFAAWHGHEVDTQGDAFFVAFSRATQAVGAAAEAQRKLADYAWPEGILVRVRMGIHTGEPWSDKEGYVGMDVHRAARIAHVGHGSQVLLSETTTALVLDELPPGVSLADLGRHLLKDIHRPERISQLIIEGLPSEFPPLTSLAALPAEGARLPRQVGKCPYRGLAAFQETDAPFYFGRETFVASLEHAIRTRQLVAVIVGSSGSGKSSALFAGLLPRLRKSGGYTFATFRPGSQPFYALAGALLPLLEPGLSETDRLSETRKLAERLAKGEISLAQVAGRLLEKAPYTKQLLLVVDQFEELYTLCPEAKLQRAFIDELLALVEAARIEKVASSVILLTLRADFMGQALAHRPFADALQEASLLMGPMTRPELHMAVEKPAEMQGAAFEPGLVERILDDVGEKPGNLPLLEFTLTQLWEQQTDGWLTHANYEAMGSVEGALSAYADQVYAGLEPSEQERTRRVLVQLVQPGEGTEDTRRIATRDELGDESWSLIQRLADRRLVVTGRDAAGHEIAEVVHEALIQKWGRFQAWMDADRLFRLWEERLRSNLRQWQESGQDEGALLRGAPLAEAEGWVKERSQELSLVEREYIQAGIGLRERQQMERERRRRRVIAGLAIGLVLSLALSLLAGQQWRRAESAHQVSFSRELAAGALNNLDADPERSVLLSLQALNEANALEAVNALHRSVPAQHLLQTLTGHTNWIHELALSPDGTLLASADVDGMVILWDAASGEKLFTFIPHPIAPPASLAFSPDGSLLATSSYDNTAKIWRLSAGGSGAPQELFTLSGHTGVVNGIAFSPDGKLFATGSDDATAILWDMPASLAAGSGQKLHTLVGHTRIQDPAYIYNAGINQLTFSPDGKYLITAGTDETVRIWDTTSGQQSGLIHAHPGGAYKLAISPDGTRLATIGEDLLVKIWDFSAAPGQVNLLYSINMAGNALAFSPDGTRLAIGGYEAGVIEVWEAASSKLLLSLPGHTSTIHTVAFSPDGTRLFSASEDTTIKIWDLSPDHELLAFSPSSVPAYSPDGSLLATGSPDGKITLRDALSGQPIFTLDGYQGKIIALEFSLDGRRLASATNYDPPKVWDLASRQEITSLKGHIDMINNVVFSPDGQRLATASVDGTASIWDSASGQRLLTVISSPPEGDVPMLINDVAFSRDSKRLVTTCVDGTAKIWDAASGQLLHTLEIGSEPGPAAYSPDGKRLALGLRAGTATVYDLVSSEPRQVLTLAGHTGSVSDIHFSPDGSLLATASYDNTIKVWDATTGQERMTLTGAAIFVRLAFNPDGRRLAAMDYDSRTLVFALRTEDLIDLARQRLTRGFTTEECKQYLHLEQCPPEQ